MASRHIVSLASLPDTHQMLQKTCRDFADNELIPNAAKIDVSVAMNGCNGRNTAALAVTFYSHNCHAFDL